MRNNLCLFFRKWYVLVQVVRVYVVIISKFFVARFRRLLKLYKKINFNHINYEMYRTEANNE